jgi:hypothetical protein
MRASSLVPYDMQGQTTGSSIMLGGFRWSAAGAPTMMDVDKSTGKAYVMSHYGGDWCKPAAMESVDVSASTVSAPTPIGYCDANIQSDGMGQNVYVTDGPAMSVFSHNTPLVNDMGAVNTQTMTFSQLPSTSGYGAIISAVDPVNQLLLVGYLGSAKGPSDNSGAGTLVEYSLPSGQMIKSFPSFSFGYIASSIGSSEGAMQLDPSTRTGWTFGSDGTEIRQFSY